MIRRILFYFLGCKKTQSRNKKATTKTNKIFPLLSTISISFALAIPLASAQTPENLGWSAIDKNSFINLSSDRLEISVDAGGPANSAIRSAVPMN
jgi:hypothetical protein